MGKYSGKYIRKEEKRSSLPRILPVILIICLVVSAVCVVLKLKDRRTEPVQVEQVIPQEVVTTPVETEAAIETTVETQPAEVTLPKLHLKGDISQMLEKSDERIVAFTYEDDSGLTEGYIKMKVQGTSSLGYDKKNYTIK